MDTKILKNVIIVMNIVMLPPVACLSVENEIIIIASHLLLSSFFFVENCTYYPKKSLNVFANKLHLFNKLTTQINYTLILR